MSMISDLSLAIPETLEGLPTVPGGWMTEEVQIAGRTIRLTRLCDPDAFLDDPDVNSEHAKNGYMPYWGYIWPASWDMSEYVLQQRWSRPLDVLEIGAGIGVVGLAALAAGLNVTFSDYDPQAVVSALFNSRQNSWHQAEGLVLDWRQPLDRKYQLIFGCDVIYERGNHLPILDLLDRMLEEDGECWLADPCRGRTDEFVMLACRRGYSLENHPLPRFALPGRKEGVTDLWILKKTRLRADRFASGT